MVVPPFEATGLNDDIWAAVHREMVEVAEVMNSMGKNKGDNSMDKNKNKDDSVEQPSSSTARKSSQDQRRQCSAGR